MAKENIQNQVLDSIDILIDKKLQEANFDRTIIGTVIECVNPVTGKHHVSIDGVTTSAYSFNGVKYEKNAEVYVKFQGGTQAIDKQILGLTHKNTQLESYRSIPFDSRYHHYDTFSFNTDMELEQNEGKWPSIPEGLQQLSAILTFKLSITSDYEKINNDDYYGIELYDREDNLITTIAMDMLEGNPYYMNEVTQIFIFNEQKILNLKKISIVNYSHVVNGANVIKDIRLSDIKFSIAQDLYNSEVENLYYIKFERGKYIEATESAKASWETPSDDDDTGTHYRCWIEFYHGGSRLTNEITCDWFMENSNVTSADSRYSSLGGEGWEKLGRTNARSETDAENYLIIPIADLPYYKNKAKCCIQKNWEIVVKDYDIDFLINENRAQTPELKITKNDEGQYKAALSSEHGYSEENIEYTWTALDNFGNAIKGQEPYDNIFIPDTMPLVLNLTCKAEWKRNDVDKFFIAENSFTDTSTQTMLLISNANQVFLYNGTRIGEGPLSLEVQLWREGEQVTSGWELEIEPIENSLISKAEVEEYTVNFEVSNVYNASQAVSSQITLIAKLNNTEVARAKTSFIFMQNGDPGTNGTKYVAQIISKNEEDKTVYNFVRSSSNYNNYTMQIIDISDGSIITPEEIVVDTTDNKILKIKGIANDIEYYAYASITELDIDQNSGFNFILYGSNGQNPRAGFNSFRYNGESYSNIKADNDYLTYNNGTFKLTNMPLTVESPKYIIIKIEEKEVPIFLLKNRYEYASINGWDGQGIDISEDYVLSPMAGFGKKIGDNSFTGVVLGQGSNGEMGLMAYGSNYGIYEKDGIKYVLVYEEIKYNEDGTIKGYSYYDKDHNFVVGYTTKLQPQGSERTVFIDANTGIAQFGVAGKGQIIIDSINSSIIGGGYTNPENSKFSQKGTKIDLINGNIYSPSFSVVDGCVYLGGEGTITGGEYDPNGTDGFAEKGMQIDLAKGTFHTKGFRIDENGNAYFKGNIEASGGNIGAFKIIDGKSLSYIQPENDEQVENIYFKIQYNVKSSSLYDGSSITITPDKVFFDTLLNNQPFQTMGYYPSGQSFVQKQIGGYQPWSGSIKWDWDKRLVFQVGDIGEGKVVLTDSTENGNKKLLSFEGGNRLRDSLQPMTAGIALREDRYLMFRNGLFVGWSSKPLDWANNSNIKNMGIGDCIGVDPNMRVPYTYGEETGDMFLLVRGE